MFVLNCRHIKLHALIALLGHGRCGAHGRWTVDDNSFRRLALSLLFLVAWAACDENRRVFWT